tara:strand:+ start:335 stop:682 length:348 start_codon:yes stop_codon:yes gene_type:complete
MCGVGAAIGAGIGLLLGSRRATSSGSGGLFGGALAAAQSQTGNVPPIEKPIPPIDSAPRPEEINVNQRASFKQSSKRAQLGLKAGSKPSDLKNIGVSSGLPSPGGRKSPTGVVTP